MMTQPNLCRLNVTSDNLLHSQLTVPIGQPSMPQPPLPTLSEASGANPPQLPLPSPAHIRPPIDIPVTHNTMLWALNEFNYESLEASAQKIDQIFSKMNQILQQRSNAMQQLINQHQLLLQRLLPLPLPPCPTAANIHHH